MKKFTPLNTAFKIAKRISFQKQKSNTSFIVRLSILATTISVAAIILTFSIVNGFQESISNKVYSFWGNINIGTLDGALIDQHPQIQKSLAGKRGIQSIIPYAIQTAVIGYKQEIEGLSIKGIPTQYPAPFLSKGRCILASHSNSSMEIVLSTEIANKLQVKLGDFVRLYFMNQGAVQQRKLQVVGLFHSGMEDYDLSYAIVDLSLLQQLANNTSLISGYSIQTEKSADVQSTTRFIQKQLPPNYIATPIEEQYPQIFDWIQVQNINRNVTMTIMLLIALVNLLTCLFILMLERVKMIGLLNALGGDYHFIRKIFLYQSSFISWIGIMAGCIIGIGLSLLQQYTGWIQLDESAYFMKVLPIKMEASQIAWIIIGTALVSYLSFLAPTIWIKKISPTKAIRFD